MPKIWRNRVFLAKNEATYGVDPVPTGASNAILCREALLRTNAEILERELIKGTIGTLAGLVAQQRCEVEAEIELAAAGAAGTAPAYGPLLRACGLSQTVNAGVSVVYAPVSTGQESLAGYWFMDGKRHVVLGARGNASLNFTAGQLPVARFTFTGLYSAPSDVVNPTTTLSAWKVPAPVSKVNSPTLSLHGQALAARSIEVDLGIEVAYRDIIGAEDVQITGRRMTARVLAETLAAATKNWEEIMRAGTTGALSFIHGTTGGSIVELAAATVSLTGVENRGEADGVAYTELQLSLGESGVSSGDNEITITVR